MFDKKLQMTPVSYNLINMKLQASFNEPQFKNH